MQPDVIPLRGHVSRERAHAARSSEHQLLGRPSIVLVRARPVNDGLTASTAGSDSPRTQANLLFDARGAVSVLLRSLLARDAANSLTHEAAG